MFSRLKAYLQPPAFEHDMEKTGRAQLLFYIINMQVLLYAAALIFPLIVPIPIGIEFLYGALATLLVFLGISILVLREGHVRAAAIVVVLVNWLFITSLCLRGGGLRSNAYPGYIMVMTLAGLILGQSGSILTVVASVVAGYGMMLSNQNGLLMPVLAPPSEPMPLWITTSFFLAGTALLQNTAHRVISNGLRQSSHNLDERQRTQEALSRERNLLRAFIDHLPDIMYVKDRNSKFLLNNAVSMQSLGVMRQEALLGKSDSDFFPPELAAQWRAQEQAVMESNMPVLDAETFQPWRRDKRRWVSETLIPLHDSQGTVIGVVGISRDITEHKLAEETISRERNLLRTLIDNLPENIYIKDRQSRFLINNAVSMRLLNTPRQEDLVGKSDFDFFPREIVEPWYAQEQAVMESGRSQIDVVEEQPWRTSQRRWVMGSMVPLRDAQGQVIGILGMNRDITESKNAEERLRLSEQRYRMLVENIPNSMVMLFDRDLRFILVDGPEVGEAGYTKAAMEGRTLGEAFSPEVAARYEPNMRAALDGKTFSVEIPFENRFYQYHYVPLHDEHGDIVYGLILGQNVTARRIAEEALRHSNAVATAFQDKLRALHEVGLELSSADTMDELYRKAVELGVHRLGLERLGLFRFEGDYLLGIYGTDEEGRLRDEHHLSWLITPETREYHLIQGGIHAKLYEQAVLKGAGEVVGSGWDALAILWNGSDAIGLLSTDNYFSHQPPPPYMLDLLALYGTVLGNMITQQQIDGDLRASEARYRVISNLISDYAFAYDVLPDGTFTPYWMTDDSFQRVTGHRWSEIGTTFKLYAPDEETRVREDVARTIAGAVTEGEYRIVSKSGETRWVYLRRQPEWDAEHSHVVRFYGVAQDITERKRLEAELQRYTQALELRVEERTVELRRAKEQIEAILNNISDGIVLAQHNGTIQSANPAFRRMFGDRIASISSFVKVIPDEQQSALLAESLMIITREGGSRRMEARVMTEDEQVVDVDLVLIGISEQDGENAAILLSAHDITYLKELERFKTAFVANAVHDLSSPITALGTRLYLLKKTPERLGEHVRILEDQIGHLKDLVTDLRSLSEIDRGLVILNREPVDLNAIVTRIFQEYEAVAEDKHVRLRLLLTPDLPVAALDRRKCERVIINLISNAIHYTPPDGEIRVRTRMEDNHVILVVEDEGVGIPKEDIPYIFERFYRADSGRHMNRAGTGLGLSIVKEMISAHGGTVTVDSEIDQGSSFTVRFPIEPDDPGVART